MLVASDYHTKVFTILICNCLLFFLKEMKSRKSQARKILFWIIEPRFDFTYLNKTIFLKFEKSSQTFKVLLIIFPLKVPSKISMNFSKSSYKFYESD